MPLAPGNRITARTTSPHSRLRIQANPNPALYAMENKSLRLEDANFCLPSEEVNPSKR